MTAAGGVTYTYGDNGNLTDRGSADDFGWDAENHLTSTTISSTSSTYEYNGDGLRMSRTIGAVTTDYVWDLSGGLPNILEDSDGVRYVYGLDLVARIDGSSEEYYLADGLGSTTALTDDTGNVTVEYAYDAFGNYRPGEGSSTNEFAYTGEQVDETGLQYLRARYYDPATGRFLSQDPLPLLQRYAYVGNNPANFVDPSGLCVFGAPCPDVPIPPIPPIVPPIVTIGACALSGDCRSDVTDFVDNVANNPGSIVQDAVGAGVAIFSSGDRSREDGVTYYENCWGLCWFLRGLPNANTITLGHFVFSEGSIDEILRVHELAHVRQGDKYGPLWIPAYLWQQIVNGYNCNKFEEEARRGAGEPSQCYE